MPVLSNSRHERFAQALAKGQTADEAYIFAGFSPNRGNAIRLKANESIEKRIAEILEAAANRAEITIARVLTELGKIGFSDIRKAVAWSGAEIADEVDGDDGEGGVPQVVVRAANIVRLMGSDQIDDDTAASISEVSQSREGSLKIKLYDKRAALVDIGKHLGMFKDQVEHSGPDGGPILVASDSERARALAAFLAKTKAATE